MDVDINRSRVSFSSVTSIPYKTFYRNCKAVWHSWVLSLAPAVIFSVLFILQLSCTPFWSVSGNVVMYHYLSLSYNSGYQIINLSVQNYSYVYIPLAEFVRCMPFCFRNTYKSHFFYLVIVCRWSYLPPQKFTYIILIIILSEITQNIPLQMFTYPYVLECHVVPLTTSVTVCRLLG